MLRPKDAQQIKRVQSRNSAGDELSDDELTLSQQVSKHVCDLKNLSRSKISRKTDKQEAMTLGAYTEPKDDRSKLLKMIRESLLFQAVEEKDYGILAAAFKKVK